MGSWFSSKPSNNTVNSHTHNKKYKPLELVVFHYIRMQYEKKFDGIYVPLALKYLIIKYSKRIIGCDLLTFKEDLDLFTLLSKQLTVQNKKCKVLYKASDHNFLASKFHEFCDGKGSTLTIIQSEYGNIFGGYRSNQWEYYKFRNMFDDDIRNSFEISFLFLIRSNEPHQRCPVIFPSKDNKVYHQMGSHVFGPFFGGHDIFINDKCNEEYSSTCKSTYDIGDINLCGKPEGVVNCGPVYCDNERIHYFRISDYYVIQLL